MSLEWYSAKSVYKHVLHEGETFKTMFEERVVLFQATDFDDAIVQAESEAEKYCRECGSECRYLGYINMYQLPEDSVGHRTEVFSVMRESELSDESFLDLFYGDER